MSIMAWYPLAQSESTPSGGDEQSFDLDTQSAGCLLWSFGSADDHGTHSAGGVRAEKHGNDADADADAGTSDEQAAEALVLPQQCTQPADDIFMSQFSDDEMRRMDDAPFEALDMFPDSMHRLLSYENMLSGVLTGSSESEEEQQQDANATLGVDTMDTCGFPLFCSHDPQNAPTDLDLTPRDQPAAAAVAASVTKRSRSVADEGKGLFFEGLVLQELEDVVFQLTKRTRVCFRDAFFRLAESSRAARCSAAAANGTPSSETGVQQAAEGGNASTSISATPGCPERETNAIDRTVADLAMKPPRAVPLEVLMSRCAGDDSAAGAKAQSATSWTTMA